MTLKIGVNKVEGVLPPPTPKNTKMTPIHKQPATTIAWLSDIHLDRSSRENTKQLLSKISKIECDALVITGDISSAPFLTDHLRELAKSCAPRNLYFVAGNHDYHNGSIDSVDRGIDDVCLSVSNLHHLRGNEIIPLSQNTALLGHRGWADARAGWGKRTIIGSRDRHSIEEFRKLSRGEMLAKMETLGQESAVAFRRTLPYALTRYRHVVIATHVPPFPDTVHFNGKLCGPTHQPHFTNLSAGMALIGITRNFPNRRVTVLAGHAHNPTHIQILNNLEARVAGAQTGHPAVQDVLEFP